MNPTASHAGAVNAATGPSIAQRADSLMMLVLLASAASTWAIGAQYGSWGLLPATLTGLLLAVGTAGYGLARGTVASMAGFVVAHTGLVILHMQLGRGTLEFHFGVFALLGLVLVYRDWRAVLATAAIFAVHHIAFDRLQAAGFAVFCTPQPDFLKILLHAAYVALQTGVEMVLAVQLRRAATESAEMVALVNAVRRGHALNLNVGAVPTTTPVAASLKQVIASMGQAVSGVLGATQSIDRATSEIAAGNLDLSQRTESQASSLQETAASMDQLSSAVRQAADTSREASRKAAESAESAHLSGQQVLSVVGRMGDIAGSSRKIAEVTHLIDSVAFQTNILALNAAVEAARAGEQGRGFAVVAAEVRNLASRSAEAAREIKSLIGHVVSEIDSGAALATQAGESMKSLVNQVQGVASLIDSVSHLAQEQAGGIAQVGRAVAEIDGLTQQNAALVEQAAAAAESLRQQAAHLTGAVRAFQAAEPAAA